MSRGRTQSQLVRVYADDTTRQVPDQVIVEEPLEIRLDGVRVATTMRTPGNDYELAAGFCFTEGLLAGHPVSQIRYCATGSAAETEFNVVSVDTGGAAPKPRERLATTTSSCGWCGTDAIDDVTARIAPLSQAVRFDPDILLGIPEQVRARQTLFNATGGVHGAATFTTDGLVSEVREDIGRHNAVDKVIGRHLLDDQLPAPHLGLFVSGRTSFELIQKAWAAGFSVVIAVSAPSSLAVRAAKRAGITLAGFAKPDRLNLYT